AAEFFKLGNAADGDYFTRFCAPDRNRRTPKTVARDRPVRRGRQHMRHLPITNMTWHPVDLLVHLNSTITEFCDLNIPARHSAINQRLIGAPAMRIIMFEIFLLD